MEKSSAQTTLEFATSYQASRAIYVVAKLDIPDFLKDGRRSASELAIATKTNAEAFYRVLRCVAGHGILEEQPERKFGLTSLGKTLCRDAPDSVRAYTIFVHEELYQCWGDIEAAVRTGEPRFEKVIGVPRFALSVRIIKLPLNCYVTFETPCNSMQSLGT